jgi:hypothetical protein
VVLEKAIARRAAGVVSVLVAAHRLDGLADVLAGLPQATPVYAAGQAAMDAVVGFPIHRGILAVGGGPSRRGDLLARLPAGRWSWAGRHRQPRQHGRRLPQRRGLRRRRRAAGRHLLRSALPQGHPGQRRAALTVAVRPGRDGGAMLERWRRRASSSPRCRRGRDELARPAAGAARRCCSAPRGRACRTRCWRAARTVRIAMAGGFDSLNVATTSGIVLHPLCVDRNARSLKRA